MLAISPDRLGEFRAICERERCPFAVVGTATADGRLVVDDPQFGNRPVDVDLAVILGKPPKMVRDVRHVARPLPALDLRAVELKEACYRVLRAPTVANKTFLVTIGDRTVGGLCARDQMVGPWQVPVADCAVTLADFTGYAGEAFAIGERTPLAVVDAPASGRMAVGEALTNLAARRGSRPRAREALRELDGRRRLPGRGRGALRHGARGGARALPAARASRSRSARIRCRCARRGRRAARRRRWWRRSRSSCRPSRRARTRGARSRRSCGPTPARPSSSLVDLARGRNRLGGSQLAQVYGQLGDAVPDLDDPAALKAFFAAIQSLNRDGLAARVPRSLRRRTLRLRVRDGLRRALRRDAQPRPPRLRSARARRRRQRAPTRAHAGARPGTRARGRSSPRSWAPWSRSGPTTGRR